MRQESFNSLGEENLGNYVVGGLPSDRQRLANTPSKSVGFCFLMMVLFLLHRVLVVHRRSYEADQDSFSVGPVVFGCFGLAALFHGNAADMARVTGPKS